MNLGQLIRIWAVSLVVVLGLFVYYYSFSNFTIALVIWIIISFMLVPMEKIKKNKENILRH